MTASGRRSRTYSTTWWAPSGQSPRNEVAAWLTESYGRDWSGLRVGTLYVRGRKTAKPRVVEGVTYIGWRVSYTITTR